MFRCAANVAALVRTGVALACCLAAVGPVRAVQTGWQIYVTTVDDRDDGSCDASDCTLREALNVVNASSDQNMIVFRPDVRGTIHHPYAEGLPITAPLAIVGSGARNVTISGDGVRRLFNITAAARAVSFAKLTLADGVAAGEAFPAACGGAVLAAAQVGFRSCTFRANHASLDGGGVYVAPGGAGLWMEGCTLTGNSAGRDGGAVYKDGADRQARFELVNCTFDGNAAGGCGGALYNRGAAPQQARSILTSCTLNRNSAGLHGGGIYNRADAEGLAGSPAIDLQNTILRSDGLSESLVNDGGTIASRGWNLSTAAEGGDTTTTPGGILNFIGDRRNLDPRIASLADNGGETDTLALLPDSPAVDTGNSGKPMHPGFLDQRQFARVGASDIGAFERGAQPLRITSVERLPGGTVRLRGIGVPMHEHNIFVLQSAYADWSTPLGSAVANDVGEWEFQDTTAVGLGARFYHSLWQ